MIRKMPDCAETAKFVAPLFFALLMAGCGGSSTAACKLTAINVFPNTATASHTAVAPGNTQLFSAFVGAASGNCAVQQSNLTNATWTVSDTTNASISNVHDATYGNATCKGATSTTVTATVPAGDGTTVSGTASLTCN